LALNLLVIKIKKLYLHTICAKLINFGDMKSSEKINKIKAVVLYILQSFKDGTDYIKLFKLMYFAQRMYLAKYGRPIFEDSFRARPLGPVPSLTYKAVKTAESGDWSEVTGRAMTSFISALNIDGKKVSSKRKPDMDYLAKYEVECLNEVINEYKDIDSRALSKMSHNDKAWRAVRKRMRENEADDMYTIQDIARAGGASKEMMKYIKEKQLIREALS